MEDSKIEVRMVCPGKGCNNSAFHQGGSDRQHAGEGKVIQIDTRFEYICKKCGSIMERKIFKLNRAETEVEIKPGENV